MTSECFNKVFLLYINKQETDSLDLISVAKEFILHTLDVKVVLENFNLAMSMNCKIFQISLLQNQNFLGSGAC